MSERRLGLGGAFDAAVRPGVDVLSKSVVLVELKAGCAGLMGLRLRSRAMLRANRLQGRRHGEGKALNTSFGTMTVVKDRARLAAEHLFMAGKAATGGGRRQKRRGHIRALQTLDTLCSGERVGCLSVGILHTGITLDRSDRLGVAIHIWGGGESAIRILEDFDDLTLGLTAVVVVLRRCRVGLGTASGLTAFGASYNWTRRRTRQETMSNLASLEAASASEAISNTTGEVLTAVVATTGEPGGHRRSSSKSAACHCLLEEFSRRRSEHVLNVRCFDVALDDFATGRFGVADNWSEQEVDRGWKMNSLHAIPHLSD